MNVISFHSFKGGACRSTTCLNTIPFLAEELKAAPERPVVVIDADLDSLGLTNILAEGEFRGTYNAKSLFSGSVISDLSKYKKVGDKFGLAEGSVVFLGVDDSTPPLSPEVLVKNDTTPLIDLLDDLDGKASAVIFDCAAGEQPSAVNVVKCTDVLVCCMRPTGQFRNGTFFYLKERYANYVGNSLAGMRTVILVPTAVSANTSHTAIEYKKFAISEIRRKANRLSMNEKFKVCQEMIVDEDNLGIPEVEMFKWQEAVLYERKKQNGRLEADEEKAYGSYSNLAKIIRGL